ncbi:MAG: hypothetical protein ACYTHJ_10170 [Planctomycetota bacterium]|jgi:hypothetical protein
MTQLEHKINAAQRRLWFNRWLSKFSASLGIAAGTFAATVLIQRLYELPIPLQWTGAGLGVAAVILSVIWTMLTREDSDVAAAALDQAAGLKERISTGRFCLGSEDPFENAVVADAESISNGITVNRHIRLTVPRSLTLSASLMVVAALMFLITPGLLNRTEAHEEKNTAPQMKEAKLAVKREIEDLRKKIGDNPEFDRLEKELGTLDSLAGSTLKKPGDVRHEAVKKIDKLADAMKQKINSGKNDTPKEFRKRLRHLKVPKSSDAPTQKLAKALNKGDFKSAKEEIAKIQEQLATLKAEKDQEMVKKLGKDLEKLAKQLEQISKNKELQQKLEQAGIKKEDVERMLQNLTKKDLEQLKKQLEKSGMSQKQIEKLAQQMKKQQGGSQMAKNLSNAMKKAGSSAQQGQPGDANAGLTAAQGQLSELEALEQEMSQMQSTMQALNQAKCNLDGNCKGNQPGNNPGQKGDQGKGGMGPRPGQGRGGLAPEEQTNVDWKTERGKVHTGQGAIISQMEFEGEQVEGQIDSKAAAVRDAREREASDRVPRDRIPRQYHKAIKQYFDNVPADLNGKDKGSSESEKENADTAP